MNIASYRDLVDLHRQLSPEHGLRLYLRRDTIQSVCVLFMGVGRYCQVDNVTYEILLRMVQTHRWSPIREAGHIVDIYPLADQKFDLLWLTHSLGRYVTAVDIISNI